MSDAAAGELVSGGFFALVSIGLGVVLMTRELRRIAKQTAPVEQRSPAPARGHTTGPTSWLDDPGRVRWQTTAAARADLVTPHWNPRAGLDRAWFAIRPRSRSLTKADSRATVQTQSGSYDRAGAQIPLPI